MIPILRKILLQSTREKIRTHNLTTSLAVGSGSPTIFGGSFHKPRDHHLTSSLISSSVFATSKCIKRLQIIFRPPKMAVSSLSSSFHSFLSPPPPLRTSNSNSNSNSNLSSISLNSPHTLVAYPHRRHSSIIVCCSVKDLSNDLSSEEKRVLREKYGFDTDEPSPDTPKRRRRKEEAEKAGKGLPVPREEKSPRTTHRLLKVLAGTARRMKLLSPKGMDVRPMMEVVKGAAFDIMQVAGGCPASLRPGRWLDLYSGTGSVGIEALSRGCSEVHFVEMDPWVVTEVLRPNLEWTGFLDNSVIHTVRVEKFLERAKEFVEKNGPFDYISVTPPYEAVDYSVLMRQISESPLVGEATFIVVEYALKTDMLDTCGSLVKVADRRFGRTNLAIYGPTWAQKKRKPKKSRGTISRKVPEPVENTS